MKQTSFNILLGIEILELLLNLVSCHRFTKKPNTILILNCQSRLVNKYLAKLLFIIKMESKQLKSLPNDVKLIIYVIDQLEKDFIMAEKNTLSLFSILFTNKNYIKINKRIYMKF